MTGFHELRFYLERLRSKSFRVFHHEPPLIIQIVEVVLIGGNEDALHSELPPRMYLEVADIARVLPELQFSVTLPLNERAEAEIVLIHDLIVIFAASHILSNEKASAITCVVNSRSLML
jgi:hypothetical protein